MKTKIILIALLMLTALPAFSQGDTVKLPFSVAKQIALDLEELDRLKQIDRVNSLQLQNYVRQVETLSKISEDKSLQIGLLQNSVELYRTQLEAEKAKKPKSNTLVWIFRSVGVFAVGYLVGSL